MLLVGVCRMVEKKAENRPSATEALAFPVVARSLEVHIFSFYGNHFSKNELS